ncbi:MAG: formylglycine-generating enzyme family protein [Gemmataceae bacterium]
MPRLPSIRLFAAGLLLGLLVATVLTVQSAPTPRPAVADHRGYRETLPETKVGFEMVAIPGGTFRMGSPETEKGRSRDEGPPHAVQVPPFWMGKCEVTWDEYEVFRKRTAVNREVPQVRVPFRGDVVTGPTGPYTDHTWGFGLVGYPAIGISHHAAMEYCRWLSQVTGKTYRLPTEAEWEYACRAGSAGAYPWGGDPARLRDHAWYDGNAGESTHPVGKKRPNRWGLYDMLGNAAEWCLDHHDADYYRQCATRPLTVAPVKKPTAARFPHVVRGGAWCDPSDYCRSAARRASEKSWNRSDPILPPSVWWLADVDYVGFRVVRAVNEQPDLRGLRSLVTPKASEYRRTVLRINLLSAGLRTGVCTVGFVSAGQQRPQARCEFARPRPHRRCRRRRCQPAAWTPTARPGDDGSPPGSPFLAS